MYEENTLVHNILKSNNPVFAFDFDSKIVFWNNGSELLFNYEKDEVIGKEIPFMTSGSRYEFDFVISRIKEGKCINFKTQKRSKNNEILDLVFFASPLYNDSEVSGVLVNVHDFASIKNLAYIPLENTYCLLKDQKRTFIQIRKLILASLVGGKKTINQISLDAGVNWRTVEKHLTFLIGKKYVAEIFSSEYVRIFELTSFGTNFIKKVEVEELVE